MNWKKNTLVTGEMTYSLSLGLVYVWIKTKQKDYNSEPTSIVSAGYSGAKTYNIKSEKLVDVTLEEAKKILVRSVTVNIERDLAVLVA